jgi:hypothetical protein
MERPHPPGTINASYIANEPVRGERTSKSGRNGHICGGTLLIDSVGIDNMRTVFVISLVALLAGMLGCNKGLTLIPVSGVVTLNGKPLGDCAVAFQPVEGGPVASGTTNAEGRFELGTLNRSGAVPGKHRVLLTKQRYVPDPNNIHYEFLTPKKYAMPNTSGLKANVSKDEHEFVFEMSSK